MSSYSCSYYSKRVDKAAEEEDAALVVGERDMERWRQKHSLKVERKKKVVEMAAAEEPAEVVGEGGGGGGGGGDDDGGGDFVVFYSKSVPC